MLVLQIFCAKCKVQDSGENNDIILCDGFCDRAFHQMCLVPPLETDNSEFHNISCCIFRVFVVSRMYS